MSKKLFILAIILAVVAVGISLFWNIGRKPSVPIKTVAQAALSTAAKNTPSQTTQSAPSPTKLPAPLVSHETQTQEMSAKISSLLNVWGSAPISFYGKVVDGQGNPIERAKADIVPWQSLTGEVQHNEKTTDAQGLFSITGIHGMRLNVSVSKEGYYQTPQATQIIGYQKEMDHYNPHPNPNDPEIFVLRKKGITEPLVMHSFYQSEVAKDGTPTNLDLQTGKETSGADTIQIQVWLQKGQNPNEWKGSVSVPGGGLMERTGDAYNFQAPANGYASEDVIERTPTAPEKRSRMTKEYWFHFADGRYARATIAFFIGGFQFVNVTSYLNPQPGHTNLEYDPDQAAQPASP
jgi:hypothetical protein